MTRLALVLSLSLLGCAAAPIDGRSAYRETGPVALDWLKAVTSVPEGQYHQLDSQGKLPPNVRGDSNYFDDKFFTEEARPLAREPLEVWVHKATDTTPDVLRYKYKVGNLNLTVCETTNLTLVWVRGIKLSSTPQEQRAALIADTAAKILRVKTETHDWHFGPEERIGQEGNFTSDASIDPATMTSWEERADGGVMHGTLYFFLYKRVPTRIGYQNQGSWFDNEFRKSIGGVMRWFKDEDAERDEHDSQ